MALEELLQRITRMASNAITFPGETSSSDEDSTIDDESIDYFNSHFKKGGSMGLKGGVYRVNLLTLILHRGLRKGYSFRLATKIHEAVGFADLLFEYLEDGRKTYSFLQAKYREKESRRISIPLLLSDADSDFSLLRYFDAYMKIIEEPLFEDGHLEAFNICTNINFEFDNPEEMKKKELKFVDALEMLMERDDIFHIPGEKSKVYRYKFKANDFIGKERIREALRIPSDFGRLARKLADCVLYNIPFGHSRQDDFRRYHWFLATEVLDENKKLRSDFLTNSLESLSASAKVFRNIFKEHLEKMVACHSRLTEQEKERRKIRFTPSSEHDILEQIDIDNVIDLNLVKGGEKCHMEFVSHDAISGFLDRLVFAVNQPNEMELGDLIQNEIGTEFTVVDSEDDYNRVFVDILDWTKMRDGNFISSECGKAMFDKASSGLSLWFDVKDPVESFTGRRLDLEALHETLAREDQLPVVLHSTCPVGKTQLAVKYAHEHNGDYDRNVIWLDATNHETLKHSYLVLGKDKMAIDITDLSENPEGVRTLVRIIHRRYATVKSLFIFDNAESCSSLLRHEFSSQWSKNANKTSILITCRDRELKCCKPMDRSIKITSLLLGGLTENDGVEFFKKVLEIEDDSQNEVMKTLSKRLSHCPSALKNAVQYINDKNKVLKWSESKFSLQNCLELLLKDATIDLCSTFMP